jgi:hypothetical protein
LWKDHEEFGVAKCELELAGGDFGLEIVHLAGEVVLPEAGKVMALWLLKEVPKFGNFYHENLQRLFGGTAF